MDVCASSGYTFLCILVSHTYTHTQTHYVVIVRSSLCQRCTLFFMPCLEHVGIPRSCLPYLYVLSSRILSPAWALSCANVFAVYRILCVCASLLSRPIIISACDFLLFLSQYTLMARGRGGNGVCRCCWLVAFVVGAGNCRASGGLP